MKPWVRYCLLLQVALALSSMRLVFQTPLPAAMASVVAPVHAAPAGPDDPPATVDRHPGQLPVVRGAEFRGDVRHLRPVPQEPHRKEDRRRHGEPAPSGGDEPQDPPLPPVGGRDRAAQTTSPNAPATQTGTEGD